MFSWAMQRWAMRRRAFCDNATIFGFEKLGAMASYFTKGQLPPQTLSMIVWLGLCGCVV